MINYIVKNYSTISFETKYDFLLPFPNNLNYNNESAYWRQQTSNNNRNHNFSFLFTKRCWNYFEA